jgi:hypothetical protein
MNTEIAPAKNESTETLIGELNALHLKARALDETIKQQFAEKLATCRAIADLLNAARTGMAKTQFEVCAGTTAFHRAQRRQRGALGMRLSRFFWGLFTEQVRRLLNFPTAKVFEKWLI